MLIVRLLLLFIYFTYTHASVITAAPSSANDKKDTLFKPWCTLTFPQKNLTYYVLKEDVETVLKSLEKNGKPEISSEEALILGETVPSDDTRWNYSFHAAKIRVSFSKKNIREIERKSKNCREKPFNEGDKDGSLKILSLDESANSTFLVTSSNIIYAIRSLILYQANRLQYQDNLKNSGTSQKARQGMSEKTSQSVMAL